MTVQLGDVAPDFTADTTEGTINFHEWKDGSWAVLFSHPKDFTPVCTTELGYTAKLQSEFAARNVKVIGLSCDSVEDHRVWSQDILDTQGISPNFPMIGDPDASVANLYGMIHPNASDTMTVRSVFVIGPRQSGQADDHLPGQHRPQLRRGAAGHRLPAVDRPPQGGHAGELAARRGRDHRAGAQ